MRYRDVKYLGDRRLRCNFRLDAYTYILVLEVRNFLSKKPPEGLTPKYSRAPRWHLNGGVRNGISRSGCVGTYYCKYVGHSERSISRVTLRIFIWSKCSPNKTVPFGGYKNVHIN